MKHITRPEGLTSTDMKVFSGILIKANDEQIIAMLNELNTEQEQRESLLCQEHCALGIGSAHCVKANGHTGTHTAIIMLDYDGNTANISWEDQLK